MKSIVEPPIIDYPTLEEWVVTYRKCLLTRVKLQEVFYEEKSRQISFLKRMYFMQFLGCNELYVKYPCNF